MDEPVRTFWHCVTGTACRPVRKPAKAGLWSTMKTSIATVSLSGDLREKLEAVAAAGFDAVEIFENDFLSFDGTPRDVGAMIRDLGMHCCTFQPFRDFEGLPEPQRQRAFDRAERKFDVMQELGADLLLVCSNVSADSLGGIDRAAADLHPLGEKAQARGLRIGFEALAWGRHISDHRDAWEVVRRADHPAVGLVLDSFHTLARKLPVDSIRAIPKDRIFLVQVADAPQLDMDLLQWSRHFRCFPGQGDLPLTSFAEALAATGYDGVLSLEVFNDQFRGGSTRRVAIDGQRSLIYLNDQLGSASRLGTCPSGLPPRAECLGVEFIEFAVDEQGASELADLLAALGFVKTGRHRSKAVARYSQGGINIVVNRDTEGFAHAYGLMHGTSVCALGLRVSDAQQVMARADALLAQGYRQAVGPGEVELPAIRGVGGSLIYFIEPKGDLGRVWEIEFEPVAGSDPCPAGAGLSAVDHISQTMQYEEMLSWLLFYTSILRLETTPQVDVTDPGGLVHSQVVQSPAGGVRIALNGPDLGRSLTSRFLAAFLGAGVQHIAFATTDIFATVRRIRANGLQLLVVPGNYYDDLEARLGLAPELLDRLRACNVLYDRDETGEYLQAYTESFAGGLFFEIVERRGYRGFGAVNAPIRIAAQTRRVRQNEHV
jgi:4-hydroxyphenylpyruvate dioxygenase